MLSFNDQVWGPICCQRNNNCMLLWEKKKYLYSRFFIKKLNHIEILTVDLTVDSP